MKLLELEGEGGEWQNFGWCVREEDGIKDLDKSVEFISKILEEEVFPRMGSLLWIVVYCGFYADAEMPLCD